MVIIDKIPQLDGTTCTNKRINLVISKFSFLNCAKYNMTRHLVINKKEFSSNRSLIYQNVGEIMLIYWLSKRGKVFFKKELQ